MTVPLDSGWVFSRASRIPERLTDEPARGFTLPNPTMATSQRDREYGRKKLLERQALPRLEDCEAARGHADDLEIRI